MRSFAKILPVDGYFVHCFSPIPRDYNKSLTHLYQPLIGVEAVALYQTLLHEFDLEANETAQTHHTLMNYLQTPLDHIYKARRKLEAIGLLKTYEHETEHRMLHYILLSPFTPREFMNDIMLKQLLYHHLGPERFSTLEKNFIGVGQNVLGTDVTAGFEDVFSTFEPRYEHEANAQVEVNDEQKGPIYPDIVLDYSWLKNSLKRRMIQPEGILTHANCEVMNRLASLYNLQTFEVENALQWALNEENELDIQQFTRACEDLFSQKSGVENLELQLKADERPEQDEVKPLEENASKEKMLFHKFETMSPREILEDYSGGNKASRQELKMISEIMDSQGLTIPVTNVLIHYTLLQNKNELSRAYLEAIASNWSRAKLETAEEAIAYARSRRAKMIESVQAKKSGIPKSYQREIIPEWVEKHRQSTEETTITPDEPTVDDVASRKQMAAALEGLIGHQEKNERKG